MATYFNQITLIGNLGRDPEDKSKNPENPMVTAAMAYNEAKKLPSGEWETNTTWFNIICFRNAASILLEHGTKGCTVFVTGKLKINEYVNKDGITVKTPEILVDTIKILDKTDKKEDAQVSSQSTKKPFIPPKSQHKPVLQNQGNFNDDDIPF